MSEYNDIKRMIDETRLVVNLLLRNGLNDYELAKRTNIDVKKIDFYLKNHGLIITAFCKDANDTREREMAEYIYESVQQKRKSIDQNYIIKEQPKLANENALINVGLLYKNEDNQIKFIVLSALTFRLKLETLSELLQVNEEFLAKKMYNEIKENYMALDYLFNNDYTNQDKAKNEFTKYYNELLLATRNKDVNKKKELISKIDNSDMNNILKKLHEYPNLTDEQLEKAIKFQIKYSTMTVEMENILGYKHYGDYNRRITRFFAENSQNPQIKELEGYYKSLTNYNSQIANKGIKK